MLKGLLASDAIVSNAECIANTKKAIANWNLGAKDVDAKNTEYWQKMAKLFSVSEAEARSRICGNCEYYDNRPAVLREMKSKYPINEYDIYNSNEQRGYCRKLEFACHTTRCCQAWEEAEFDSE